MIDHRSTDSPVISFPSLKAQPARRHIKKNHNLKVIDSFFNTLKNIVSPSPVIPVKNETDKGLDVQFQAVNSPSLGKNQDFQLIYFGTKWCGAGDIAKNKRDIGYFYLTGLHV